MVTLNISKLALLLCGSLFSSALFAQETDLKIELLNKPCVEKTAARVAVLFSGDTQLNGKPVSLQELSYVLKDKKKITMVCYHRELPESKATPQQTDKVIYALIQERLPIAFYWDAQLQKFVSFKE